MTNEKSVLVLSFVHPKTHRPVVVHAPIEGFWETVYGMPCDLCGRMLDREKALFQPPIGLVCKTCHGECFS